MQSLNDYSEARDKELRLESFHQDLGKARDRVQSFKDREKLFEIEQGDYDELEEIIEEFKPFHHLWHSAIEFKHLEDEWRNNALETMVVAASKEGIRFSVQGDIGTGNVLLKPRESDKPEDRVNLTVHEPVNATFALRYLVTFSKAAPLCGSVEIGLGPDAPLLVKFDLDNADNGFLQFYLAPKIDE